MARHAGTYALGAGATALGGAAIGAAAKFAAEKAIDWYVAPYFHSTDYSSKPQVRESYGGKWDPPSEIDERLESARRNYRAAAERTKALEWYNDRTYLGRPREWIDYSK